MSPPDTIRRRLLLAIAVTAVLLLTLSPGGIDGGSARFFCLTCGDRVLSDTLLNFALFVPVGLAAATVTKRVGRATVIAVGLSLLVEGAQHQIIAGRDSSLRDILANSLGGLAGAALLRWAPRLLAVSGWRSATLSLCAAGVVGAVIAGTGWLMEPVSPWAGSHASWTTPVGSARAYRGRVVSAHIDGAVARGPLGAEAARMLAAGAPLHIRAVAGPQTRRLGSLVALVDHSGELVLLVGVQRRNVVVRYRTRAMDLGFDHPDVRFRGALRGVQAGDTVEFAVTLARPAGLSLEIAGVRHRQNPGISSGWTLLYNIDRVSRATATMLGLCWVVGLVAPAGFWLRNPGTNVATISVLAVLLANLPGLVHLRALTPGEWAAAAVGLGFGSWFATRARQWSSAA
jgi:VanZ like family